MIGVSPAFYLSKYGTHFTLADLIESMSTLSRWGFDSMQLEVFHPEQLDEWSDENCRKLKEQSLQTGIHISQFVAHFLLAAFDSRESLFSDSGYKEAEFLAEKLVENGLSRIMTIPLPSFKGDVTDPEIQKRFDEKLNRIMAILLMKNVSLALEPQPGSLGADLTFLEKHPRAGLNLDPGHLLCSGIDPFSLDKSLLSRVLATHLCDNDGVENLSLAPGTYHRGRWTNLIADLEEAGYSGSLDLEIICASDEVENTYKKGLLFLNDTVFKINNTIKNPAGSACNGKQENIFL